MWTGGKQVNEKGVAEVTAIKEKSEHEEEYNIGTLPVR